MQIIHLPSDIWTDNKLQPLPTDLYGDDWVLYHGTSNLCEALIDMRGLEVDDSKFINKRIIERVVSIYDRLDWSGKDKGRYARHSEIQLIS